MFGKASQGSSYFVLGLTLTVCCMTLYGEESNGQEHIQKKTFWTTGAALMPAWGFYPNGSAYGGTKPLKKHAAWNSSGTHRLTWVAHFPADGQYHVWVRRYGGYGSVVVSVDEKPVTGGKGGDSGNRYVWNRLGIATVSKGTHHVDVDVAKCMLDAVLFTNEKAFPKQLPEPEEKPVLRALRTYRDDSALKTVAGRKGFVVGSVVPYALHLYDWMPTSKELISRLQLWGSANQYISGAFAVRALEDADEFKVSLKELSGPGSVKLGPDEIDLRVVYVRERMTLLFEGSRAKMLVPELLLRDDRTAIPPKGKQGGYGGGECVSRIPAHQSRQFWLTVHVPEGSPAGLYEGIISLSVTGSKERRMELPIEMEALPIDLQPAEGYYSIYYPAQPVKPERAESYVTFERYLAELKDQVRHGLNAATLYGGVTTLKYAQAAGMTKAPCLMHWPDDTAHAQVKQAKEMGFEALYYYGVDEPRTEEQIERCRKEAERRLKAGLHMMTAINSRAAQAATRDFIDRPVYNIYVFGGKNNEAAMYARQKGFKPVSYWTTATHYPLWYRALTGLYNNACGYLGTCPWAYMDSPGQPERLYNPDNTVHKVAYPDEFGEPIPTLGWEAYRAGIDDVRYLEALDRAIVAAERRLKEAEPHARLEEVLAQARKTRKNRYESIGGRWFDYLVSLKPGYLEKVRRDLADATVVLVNVLNDEKR